MLEVSLTEAAAKLPELVRRAEQGEEVLIADEGRPVARLSPVPRGDRPVFGFDRGRFVVPDDFDAPVAIY